MLIPPFFIWLKMGWFRFWFPLFVLWPILALVEFVLLPVAILIGMAIMPWGVKRGLFVMGMLPFLMDLFAATRGLVLEVSQGGKKVFDLKLV